MSTRFPFTLQLLLLVVLKVAGNLRSTLRSVNDSQF